MKYQHYVIDDETGIKDLYSEVELIQIAFLRTFPKNICKNADSNKRYPYYLMLSNMELMKVHGSSVTSRLAKRPEWICCQNIVISSVTHREMTKLVVPLKENYFDSLRLTELKKASAVAKRTKTMMLEFDKVPTSLIQFYRRRNRIEQFQKLFKENKIYLETEEELEKVLYFYLVTDVSKQAEDKKRVQSVNQEIEEYAKTMIKKRHAQIKVSERTKFQVNENCQIVDILNNAEYLGILVKSVSKEIRSTINDVQNELKISDDFINIQTNIEGNVTFIYLMNKVIAADFYRKLNKKLSSRVPPVTCFELKGGNEEFGGKFKKWKFIVNWYQGLHSDKVTIQIYNKANLQNLMELLNRLNEKEVMNRDADGQLAADRQADFKPYE